MPTYDYKCLNCNFTFEEFQKMTDSPLENCPECDGTLKRLIGAGAAPIFKGSGFYQTDYKNTSNNSSADTNKAKPDTDKTATKKNSKTEKKSA